MVMGTAEKFVTARPLAGPRRQIFSPRRWALALAHRGRGSCRAWPLTHTLPVTLALLPPPLPATGAGSITLACLPAPPAPGFPATLFTAITRLRPLRPEQPLAAFEQTTPGP